MDARAPGEADAVSAEASWRRRVHPRSAAVLLIVLKPRRGMLYKRGLRAGPGPRYPDCEAAMSKFRIAVSGAMGRMGAAVVSAALESGEFEIGMLLEDARHPSCGKDAAEALSNRRLAGLRIESGFKGGADAIVDFSSPQGLSARISECVEARIPLVSGTTGLDAALSRRLAEASARIPVMHSPNMSLGVNLMYSLVESAAKALSGRAETEIAEIHHDKKADAPSGTAGEILRRVLAASGAGSAAPVLHGREGAGKRRTRDEIGVHALRGGTVTGEHTVYFFMEGERIEITHRAENRSIFAHGALWAAKRLAASPAGLHTFAGLMGLP